VKERRISKTLRERAGSVRYILLDVDGVLTDGRIYVNHHGEEMTVFNIYDGQGITLLQRSGIGVGILSGRSSGAVMHRAKELGIADVYQGIPDKNRCYDEILRTHGLREEETSFVGDDLIDLPLMRRVGFAVAVSNAVPEVKSCAHLVTERCGGEGAIREVAELLLKVQGKWNQFYGV